MINASCCSSVPQALDLAPGPALQALLAKLPFTPPKEQLDRQCDAYLELLSAKLGTQLPKPPGLGTGKGPAGPGPSTGAAANGRSTSNSSGGGAPAGAGAAAGPGGVRAASPALGGAPAAGNGAVNGAAAQPGSAAARPSGGGAAVPAAAAALAQRAAPKPPPAELPPDTFSTPHVRLCWTVLVEAFGMAFGFRWHCPSCCVVGP